MKTYIRHRSLNVVDVKELFALEYLDFEGKYKDYSEKHNFFEICFVLHGEITLTMEGEPLSLSRGELVFIEPNTEHSYFSESGNKSRAFVICFECTSSAARSISGRKFVLNQDQEFFIQKIIKESFETFLTNDKDLLELLPTANFGGQQAIHILIEYLLIDLIRQSSSEKNADIVLLNGENFYPDLVELIKRYLDRNIGKKISLDGVSKKFNYSRSFISKIFKDQTGESIISYFNRIKIEKAKKLLSEGDMQASEISELLGFSEPKYFGTIFKSQVGTSPAAYREQIRRAKKEENE